MRTEDEVKTAIDILESNLLEVVDDDLRLVVMRAFQLALKWVIDENLTKESIH